MEYTSGNQGSDFALISLNQALEPINSYKAPGHTSEKESLSQFVHGVSSDLRDGDVTIILSNSEVVQGYLFERIAGFMNRSDSFETRKVFTEKRLGNQKMPKYSSSG